MTTPLVMSVTDELVAELEALASECGQHGANWYEPHHMEAFPEYACDQDFVVAASPATILALLAERAELKRDAERLNKLDKLCEAYGFEDVHEGNRWMIDGPFGNIRDAADSMPEEAEQDGADQGLIRNYLKIQP